LRNAAKSKTAENQAEEDQGQPASSQPSQAPTAAEPRNTNTDETMMGRAPQSVREKTAMEKVGVMVWPSWAQRASGLLGPCLHSRAQGFTGSRVRGSRVQGPRCSGAKGPRAQMLLRLLLHARDDNNVTAAATASADAAVAATDAALAVAVVVICFLVQ
jgi:hypothetical protein